MAIESRVDQVRVKPSPLTAAIATGAARAIATKSCGAIEICMKNPHFLSNKIILYIDYNREVKSTSSNVVDVLLMTYYITLSHFANSDLANPNFNESVMPVSDVLVMISLHFAGIVTADK